MPTGAVPMVNNLFQGMPLDPATGLYYERARWYSPSLGTWVSQDPLSYVNGADTYQFVTSSPVGAVDPSGLWVAPNADLLDYLQNPPPYLQVIQTGTGAVPVYVTPTPPSNNTGILWMSPAQFQGLSATLGEVGQDIAAGNDAAASAAEANLYPSLANVPEPPISLPPGVGAIPGISSLAQMKQDFLYGHPNSANQDFLKGMAAIPGGDEDGPVVGGNADWLAQSDRDGAAAAKALARKPCPKELQELRDDFKIMLSPTTGNTRPPTIPANIPRKILRGCGREKPQTGPMVSRWFFIIAFRCPKGEQMILPT